MKITLLPRKISWLARLNIILIAVLLLAAPACQLTPGEDPSQDGAKLPSVPLPIASRTPEIPKDWYTVYFSDPARSIQQELSRRSG